MLLPVVGILICQTMRIYSEMGIVYPEQGAAIVGGKINFVSVVSPLDDHSSVSCPAFGIDFLGDSVTRRRGCHNICYECFIPAGDLHILCEKVVGRPVPVQDILSVLPVPVPVYPFPEQVGFLPDLN